MEYLAGIMEKSGQHIELISATEPGNSSQNYPEFIVQIQQDYSCIRPEEIMYLAAEGSYTRLHLTEGREARVSRKIKAVQALLDSDRFVRIHHSYVVNLQYVSGMRNRSQASVQLGPDIELSLSRSRKSDFMQRFIRL